MQSAFPFVVFGAVGLSVVMSLVFLLTGRRSAGGDIYDEIGAGGISREGDYGDGQLVADQPPPGPDSPAARAEREREVRQMLSARSERRVRRGEPALDIDAEVARLLEPPQRPPAGEPGLTEEVRQLVVARNERRQRRGLEPLDVDSEVARALEELNP
jgi:hypothetical protein